MGITVILGTFFKDTPEDMANEKSMAFKVHLSAHLGSKQQALGSVDPLQGEPREPNGCWMMQTVKTGSPDDAT